MIKRAYNSKLELRTGETGPVLQGYGFLFSETTEDGCYGKERFSPDVQIEYDKKTFLLRDHDRSKILGRRGKNVTIDKDSEGLAFSVSKLPPTPLAEETRTLIKEDLLNDVSVGFYDLKSDLEDGVRVFKKIRLCELSLLGHGYYESGQVTARAKEPLVYPPEVLV